MTIEVELHDGSIAEFPDGTPTDVMARAAGNYAGLMAPPKPPAAPRTAAQAQPVPGSSFESEMTGSPVEPLAPTSVMESFEARSAPPMPAAVPPARQFTQAQGRMDAERVVRSKFDTQLSPQEEFTFAEWKKKYAPNDSGEDYDLRGAFKSGMKPSADGHWSDEFKKPNHPTFSNQSRYAAFGDPGEWAGVWDPKTRTYTPPVGPDVFTPASAKRPANWRNDVADSAMGREPAPAAPRAPTTGEIMGQQPRLEKGSPTTFATDEGGVFVGTQDEFTKEHGKKSGVLDDAATYPDQWKYGASADIAAAARWLSQVDAEIARNDAIVQTRRVALPRALAGQQGDVARPANQADIDKANAALPILRKERDRLEMIRSGADLSLKESMPKNPSTVSKAVGSIGRSAVPTLAGVAAGMVAGPAAGFAVGIGLGAAQQGSGTFADVIEAGRDAKERLATFDAQPDRNGYLQAILSDPSAPETVLKSAKRVAETVDDIGARLKAGMLSSSAARQMTERAYGSFKRDMEFIARGADAGYANVSAGIDAIAEGVGEAIGLGPLLRTMKMTGLAKSGFLPSFAEAVVANYGQEYATQLMQTLNAHMRADPNVTLKDALEQAHEAGVGGALMGGGLHAPLYAAGKAAERAAGGQQPAPTGRPGGPPPPPPPAPGTTGDLAATLKDSRPLAEIRAEQAREQTQAMEPHVEQAAGVSSQQEMLDGEAKDGIAEAAGIPKRGEQAVITWPDGEVARGTIRDVYQVPHPNSGDTMSGAQVELENGQIIDVTTADVKIAPVPVGSNLPKDPIVVQSASDMEQARRRIDEERSNEQIIADNDRKAHVEWNAIPITLETAKGTERRDVKNTPPKWVVPQMPHDYGRIKGVKGADGDALDIALGDKYGSQQIWIIDQIDPATGKFDEHKVFGAFGSAVDAVRSYRASFADDTAPSRIGAITHMPLAQFKEELKTRDWSKPVKYVEPAAPVAQEPVETPEQEKRRQIDEGFAANRAVLGNFKKGDRVQFMQGGTFTQDDGSKREGRLVIGTVQSIQDKEQGTVKVIEDGGGDWSVAARHLIKGEPNVPTEEKPAVPETGGTTTGPTGGGYVKPELPGAEPGKEEKPAGDSGVPREGEVGVEPPAPPVAQPPVQPPAPPVAQPPAPPVAPTKKERFVVDGKVETASGRMIPAPPALRMESDRKLNVDLKKLEAWLVEQAIDEAKAIGNDLAVTMFGGARGRTLSQSDKDGMNVLLFGEEFPEFIIKKEPVVEKQPKEPKKPKEKKPELTASEKLHGEILDALENNDRDAMGKLIYQDTPVTDEMRPEIDPGDRLVRLVVKTEAKKDVQTRLMDIGFKVSDLQDVTADDGTTKNKVLRMSAIYRPSKDKIGDFGEKMGGKRADARYNPMDVDIKLSADVDAAKAVEKIIAAVAKDRIVTAEMPGQSFGQFMFMEALWHRAESPADYIARMIGGDSKADIARVYGNKPERIVALAKQYADTLLSVQKLVEGKQRVDETADALKNGLAILREDGVVTGNTPLGVEFESVWGESPTRVIGRIKHKFSTNEDSTDQTNREVKKPADPAPLAEIIRKGKDWRQGKVVTKEMFEAAFGFRGVDFGNWMTVDERQAGLNYAFDALMDLTVLTGLPAKAIGLGRTLGFGIGSRGVGNRGGRHAAATYHPDNRVINLTKTHGNGTVYHEWMHALEDYLRKYSKTTIYGINHTDKLREALRLKSNIAALESRFRAKLSEDASTGRDRNVPPKERALAWANNKTPHYVHGWWTEHYGIRARTTFNADALEMDGGKIKYWAEPHELVARAWESFTYDESKGKTPYGVGPHVADGYWTKKSGYDGTAYPAGPEREYVVTTMKRFLEALKVDDTGAITIKEGAIDVIDRQIEEAKAELARLVENVDKIMEEMGIRQHPEQKDGSMTESMFYHMRSGWWPKDKHALRTFVAQAHKKSTNEVDDLLLRQGVEDFEAAMARYAGQLIQDWKGKGLDDRAIYDRLFEMYNTQPLLDVRTSTVVMNQQYSTPLPIAYIAGVMGHVGEKTVGYDPTAGNGLLGITLNPKRFIANELDDRRYKNLTILETRAHHGDALETHERKVYKPQEADTVLMNPPFGLMTDPQKEDGYTIKRIDQWIAMSNLDAMADKGRAVLILGASRDAGVINQNELDFFHWLWINYNVVDHFEITGKLYARQGASWPIRVLVIAGRSPSKLPRPVSGAVDRLESRDDIWARVEKARDAAATPVAGGVSKRVVGAGKTVSRDGGQGKPGDVGVGVSPGVSGETGGRDAGAGAGIGAPVDTDVPGAVQPGELLPGGRGPGDVGAQPDGTSGVPAVEPGSIGTGRTGSGAPSGERAGGPDAIRDPIGGSGLTDQDLDDIFGDDAPRGPKKPKVRTKRSGPRAKAADPAKTNADDVTEAGGPMDQVNANSGDLVGAFDAIDAILNGRATAPKPFPQKKSGSSSRALVAAQHKTVENRVADQGEWWVSDLVDEVLVDAKPLLDAAPDSDVVFMGKQGPQIDATILQKLRPHFELIWKAVSEKAKAARDAAIAFRDLVVEKWGAKVLAYAKAFIVEKLRQVQAVGQKGPVNNAIENADQVFYQGLSQGKNEGVMIPRSQLEHSKRALAALDSRLRNQYPDGIDQFVKEMVGYESIAKMHEHLFGYQVDGVALQLDAMMTGKAFIVGDDTGVGKGRQAAALVVWAQKEGKIPIFMTAQDNLYSDLYRDMEGIGFDKPEWIQPSNTEWKVTNEYDEEMSSPGRGELTGNKLAVQMLKNMDGQAKPKKESKVPPASEPLTPENTAAAISELVENVKAAGEQENIDVDVSKVFPVKKRKALFTTYAQMQGPAGSTRRAVIERLVKAGKAVLILDESHKAAGESGVGKWLVKMTTDYAPPVAFFSATFAKRADSLPIYMRTDLRHVAPTVPEVIDTIVSGGPQMQVTISEMLVEAGQMVRRERSYNGIVPKFDIDENSEPVDARTMNEVTDRLRAILAANREFNAWAKQNKKQFQELVQGLFPENVWLANIDAKELDKNLGAFNFASTVHNYVKQFLLAVKAERIVQHVVKGMNEENHEGTQQKFVIGLENTMEAALDDFTEMESVKSGDSMAGYSWRSVLQRAERRARTVSLKIVGTNKRIRVVLPLEIIPGHVQASFRRAQTKIEAYESALPASPIDFIRWQLGKHYVYKEGGKVRVALTPPKDASGVRPFTTSEITGRENIVEYDDEGNMTLGKRDDPSKRTTINEYQNGGIDAAILNISGTTGISMHPNAKVKDQRVRHMLIAQPLGDINEFKQLSGRINRTGQVELPLYTFIGTALPAEKRPLAVLRRKLRSLTSNTKSATESMQDLDLTDFVNQYGDEIVTRWLREHPEYVDMLAIKEMPENTTLAEAALSVSGKIAVLEVVDQAQFYDEIEHNYAAYIKELTDSGENKLIRRALPLKAQVLGENELGEGDPSASSPFLKGSFLQKLSVVTQNEVPTKEKLLADIADFYEKAPANTHDALVAAIEAELKVPYDEATSQVSRQIDDYEKQLTEPDIPELERQKVDTTLQTMKQKAASFAARKQKTLTELRNYVPGRVMMMHIDGEDYTAVVTNLSHQSPGAIGHGNPYAPSRFRLSFALNAPRPRLNLTLARIEAFQEGGAKLRGAMFGNVLGGQYTEQAQRRMEEAFDPTKAKAAGGRETRYMVIGNIPSGFNMVQNKGEIVTFTYESGDEKAGVLLPHKFNPAKDISDSFPIKDMNAGAQYLLVPLYRAIKDGFLEGYADYAEFVKKAKEDFIDLEYSGEDAFNIQTNGLTNNTGAVTLKVRSRSTGLEIEIDSKLGKKIASEMVEDKRLHELMGTEFSKRKGQDWQARVDLQKNDLQEFLRYFAGKWGLNVPLPTRDLYKRIRDTMARRDEGEIKLMGMSVPTEPKGVSDETRKKVDNTSGRRLQALRRSVMVALRDRNVPEGMFTKGILPRATAEGLRELEDFLGITALPFKNNNPEIFDFQGATLRSDGDVFYINVDAPVPAVALAAHEGVHLLRNRDERLYQRMVTRIRPMMQGMDKFRAMVTEGRGGKEASWDLTEEELIADILADAMLDPVFAAKLYGRDPTLFQRIYSYLIKLLDQLGLHLKKPRSSHKYVTDLQGARDVLSKVLSERRANPPVDDDTVIRFDAEFTEAMRKEIGKDLDDVLKLMPAQPGGIKVIDKQAGREGMLPLKRFFYNPVNAFQKFPVIAALQRFAVHIETDMSKIQRRFMSEFEDLRKKLSDEQWDELAGVLFVGDAEAVEWTEADLREHGITDDKVVTAYKEFRTLITKVGRLVDMHRRSMLPKYRARKQALLERMRSLRNMTDPEFRALYGQRTRLLASIRAGGTATMNVEQLHARLDAVEMQLNVKREAMDEYQDLQEQVDQIDAILAQTSIRRRTGYVPHKFFGTFAIYRAQEEEVIDPETLEVVRDANGDPVTRPINVLVAGEHGFFPTQQDAVAAAKKYLADNPGTELTVRPVQFKFPNSSATTLTDASYWRLLGRMGKELGLHGQDLKDAMEGVARRRFRRRIAGFTKMRTGVEGFSRDLERVMQAHLQEASRYVYLDKLKYRAINDMEKMGLSPFRSTNQQYPTLGPMVEAFLRDMNGQKSSGEAAADEVLDKMMSSKWGSPAVIGTTAGSAAASALMFGISTNPLLGLLVGSYVGYRFYSSLKHGGEFKTRALTGDMMSDMAHLKLGMLLNISSAIVNLTQTMVNTLPVLKPKYTMIGFQKFEAALRSYVLGKPNSDWRLLERTDAESINKFGEHKGARVIGTGSVKKLFDIPKSKLEGLRYLENAKRLGAWTSMLAFDSAESLNRGVSFLGGYYRAKDEGKTPGESFREAEKVMLFTQHNYGKSNKPEIMRNVFFRLPLQFKNYVAQQIAFTFDMARKAATGRSLSEVPFDRDALAYHLTSLFLLTGAIGMPLIGVLAAIIKGIFDYDVMDELKKKALEMQAHGKLAASAATTLARGLPAAIFGEDLSGRAGMGEQFLPFDPSNPWGPWLGTVKNQIALAEMQAGFIDQLQNISPAAKPFKAMEAMANGLPARDLILRPKTFFEALADDRIDWTNPWKNGYTEYDQTMISKRDVIRMGMGSTPTTVSELRDVERVAVHETDQHKRKTRLYVNRVIAAARRYESDPAELNKVLDNVAAQMEKDDFMVSASTMQSSYRNAFTPRVLRTLKSVPRAVKPGIAGMIEPLMDRQKPEEARP